MMNDVFDTFHQFFSAYEFVCEVLSLRTVISIVKQQLLVYLKLDQLLLLQQYSRVARVDLAREIYLILTYVHVCTKYAYQLVLLLEQYERMHIRWWCYGYLVCTLLASTYAHYAYYAYVRTSSFLVCILTTSQSCTRVLK